MAKKKFVRRDGFTGEYWYHFTATRRKTEKDALKRAREREQRRKDGKQG